MFPLLTGIRAQMQVDRQSMKLGHSCGVFGRSLEPTCLSSSPHCKNYTKTAESFGASCLDVSLTHVNSVLTCCFSKTSFLHGEEPYIRLTSKRAKKITGLQQ